ncbi:hypothetical protein ACPCG0_07355 [Propionibacteriaceae bacterium Y1923]
MRFYFVYLLQATGRFRESTWSVVADRGSFLLCVVLLLVSDHLTASLVIASDLVGKILSLSLSAFWCRSRLTMKFASRSVLWPEVYSCVRVGSRLLLANLAGVFIIGVARMGVERGWDIEVFAQVSLALSLTAVLTSLLNAVGLVVFPFLRRVASDRLSVVFAAINGGFAPIPLIALCFYPFVGPVVRLSLPEYSSSVYYLGLVLPMLVFESKLALVVVPMLKAVRLEAVLLRVNMLGVALSIVSTFCFVVLLGSLQGLLVSTSFVVAARCLLAEWSLGAALGSGFRLRSLFECGLVCCFVVGVLVGSVSLWPLWVALFLIASYGCLSLSAIRSSFRELGL